ncbi:MAG: glycosyltransferase [Deltaproteobacteria bacterium]|nr:glycosyltransferase [Deltaproteobacteria bacterium]
MLTVDVVIPALNEASSIVLVLDAIPKRLVRRIVVVDNGSTDGTPLVAERAGAIVVSESRRGYGSACMAGLVRLATDPPAVVVFLDADFSDHPEEMESLLAAVCEGNADLVIGSRARGNLEPGALAPQARFGNRLACFLVMKLYGYRYTDLGPFRAVRWDALRRLEMSDATYGWTIEMQVKALRHRLRVAEVPVSYRRRIGRSKITGTVTGSVGAGAKILWTVFRYTPWGRVVREGWRRATHGRLWGESRRESARQRANRVVV